MRKEIQELKSDKNRLNETQSQEILEKVATIQELEGLNAQLVKDIDSRERIIE